MELTFVQVLVIGAIASVLGWVFNFIANKWGWHPGRRVITVIVFVVSTGLAFVWVQPEMPVGGSPADLAQSLTLLAVQVTGMAVMIYNVLIVELLEKLAIRLTIMLKLRTAPQPRKHPRKAR